ncbi:MAG: phytoene/squalene synthase family protein [Myxococcota bacterium]
MIDPQRVALDEAARRTLATHGKTFAWASRALGRETGQHVATLYAFCRRLDDLVDDKPREEARAVLDNVRRDLANGRSEDVVVQRFLDLADACEIEASLPLQLLAGFESDLGRVRIESEAALVQYAYRVAGTVGLMANRIFGVRDRRADPFAIDLGIAMQLTNIARDVVEDAERDRVYLPRPWIPRDITPTTLLHARLRTRLETRVAVNRTLALAERYYRSADVGLIFLPARARLAVVTASRCYEAIGESIRAQRDKQWGERAYVRPGRRLHPTGRAASAWLGKLGGLRASSPPPHDERLHRPLRGWPGADPLA